MQLPHRQRAYRSATHRRFVPLAVLSLGWLILYGCSLDGPRAAETPKEPLPTTGEEVISQLEQLPGPVDVMTHEKPTDERSVLLVRRLEELSKLPKSVLDEAYDIESQFKVQGESRITQMLSLLTRMAYRVEDMKERRRFPSHIDNGEDPYNWLHPLRIREDGHFELIDTNPLGNTTGSRSAAAAEWEYVSKRVPLRWKQEGSGEKTPRP